LAQIACLQLGDPVDGGVFRLARVDRRHGGLLDVVGRVEIGLARAEADHVLALRLELGREVRDGDGGGGLHAGQRVGKEGHRVAPAIVPNLLSGGSVNLRRFHVARRFGTGPMLRVRPRPDQAGSTTRQSPPGKEEDDMTDSATRHSMTVPTT
jgi:hypothetical protein